MANTTFQGPVRSENGFEIIKKNNVTGAVKSTMSLKEFTATVTVAAGATTGKETSIQIPTNFIPLGIGVVVTSAAANAVNLVDVGTDADTDGYVDGASLAVNTVGWKGFLGCNGVLGMSGFTPGIAGLAGDEVEIVLSGAPGGTGVTIALKVFGIDSTSDTE
jgi:hypothetical protein|tara:strand:+ start:54 stop:539 length:486 start_codon:yes stop_codon:yes gene_type:complete